MSKSIPKTLRGKVARLGACGEARAWADVKDPRKAWYDCERGDWLLWTAAKLGVDRERIVRTACACAREVLWYVPEREERPRIAIETAERWCDGGATMGDVQAAAYAAYAAAAADYVHAAYAAAHAAYAAAYAAYAADAAHARQQSLKRSANIVRGHLSWRLIRAAAVRQGLIETKKGAA